MSYSISALQLEQMLGRWRSRGPAYRDLGDSFRVLIMDGRLPLGSRVPAERLLASRLALSRNTVTAAYRLLRQQGYLRSHRGAGSFISRPDDRQQANRVASWVPERSTTDLIDFTIASPSAPVGFLRETAQVVSEWAGSYAHLYDPGYDLEGVPQLRQAIADYYTNRGLPTVPEQIMVTAGAQHAWSLLVRALTRQHDRILMDSPTYPNAMDAIRTLNRRWLAVALDNCGWNADLISTVIRNERPALGYIMADFHNPTGLVMPVDVRSRIIDAAQQAGTYLIFDETLSDLAIEDTVAPSELPEHRSNRVIFIGSLSKVFWAGMRLGWLRAQPSTVSNLVSARAATDVGNPIVPQVMACHILSCYPELIKERRAMLLRCREALVDTLRSLLPSWTFTEPRGGLSLWVNLGAQVSTRLSMIAPEHGVSVLAGARFGADGTLDNRLRLPFVHEPDTAVQGIRRLAAAFRAVNEAG